MFRVSNSNSLQTIFIDRCLEQPIGEWLTARAPRIDPAKLTADGFYLLSIPSGNVVHYTNQKPMSPQVMSASLAGQRWIQVKHGKRGTHYYDIGLGADGKPLHFAHHPGWHSCQVPMLNVVNNDGCVWAEVEIPADDYHIRRLNISGITKTREPIEWYISERLRIVRVINDEEVQEIRQKHG